MSLFKKTVLSISLTWIVFLFLCGGMTFWSIYNSKSKPSVGGDLSKEIHESMLKNIWCKDFFVNLNGGYSRLLGQRMCNGVLKLNTGQMLTVVGNVTNFYLFIDKTEKLTDFCNHLNIPTLFVMFPNKIDSQKAIIPIGAPSDYSIEKADLFLSKLKKTPYLNLHPYIASNEVDVTMNFFKTDHHWNFQGAMKAFPYIVDKILTLETNETRDIVHTNINAWQECNLGRRFLGSLGRRTGAFFAGSDENPIYYKLKFDTGNFFKSIPHKRIWRDGSFAESNIFEEHLEEPKSYLLDPGYAVYGFDYPMIVYRNACAPIKKKILIIKDSYANPILAFLSTIFSEFTALDLRKYKDMSAQEYIHLFAPDIVCIMYYPNTLSDRMFNFGSLDNIEKMKKTLVYIENLLLDESQNNYAVVCESIGPDMKVSCSVGDVNRLSGDFKTISFVLCDSSQKNIIFEDRISTEFKGEQKIIFSVPKKYNSYKILIYAGERRNPQGNSFILRDVKVEILENKTTQ